MNKQIIITILLALIAVAGQAQVKCHVEGTLETEAWGDIRAAHPFRVRCLFVGLLCNSSSFFLGLITEKLQVLVL